MGGIINEYYAPGLTNSTAEHNIIIMHRPKMITIENNWQQRHRQLIGAAGILAVAAVWGSSFVFMKNSLDYITPLWFLACRFLLAAVLMWLLMLRRGGKPSRKALRAGLMVGLPLAAGYYVQTLGLMRTTVGNSAFITGVYVVFVPLLGWFFTRRIRPSQVVLGFATLVALAVFALDGELRVSRGDLLVLSSTVMYALHFLVLDKYTLHYDSLTLATLQISFAALLTLSGALVVEPLPTAASFPPLVWGTLLYTAALATAAAFFIQTAAQRVLPPTTASVLFTSESLFGAVFGVMLLEESFLPRQLLGAAMMIGCMVASVLLAPQRDSLPVPAAGK